MTWSAPNPETAVALTPATEGKAGHRFAWWCAGILSIVWAGVFVWGFATTDSTSSTSRRNASDRVAAIEAAGAAGRAAAGGGGGGGGAAVTAVKGACNETLPNFVAHLPDVDPTSILANDMRASGALIVSDGAGGSCQFVDRWGG